MLVRNLLLNFFGFIELYLKYDPLAYEASWLPFFKLMDVLYTNKNMVNIKSKLLLYPMDNKNIKKISPLR